MRFLDLVNNGQRPKGPDFLAAVRKLCDLAGVRFPERSLTPEQAETARKNEARRSILDTVMDYARERLWASSGKDARAYLHTRGFTDEDMRSLGLGLYESASVAREAILEAGHDEKEAEEAPVLWKKLEGYIVIPWACCGLRRGEAVSLTLAHIEQRDGRWAIVALRGKHGRVRTIPVPAWVKLAVDVWAEAAAITEGRLLRSLNRHSRITGSSLSPQAVLAAVRFYGKELGLQIQPHDLRRTCAKLCRSSGGELEQIQLLLGHASI